MAYTVERVYRSQVREEQSNGTGTGTLYVEHIKSPDGVVDVAEIWSTDDPSTTDTYGIGSIWHNLTDGGLFNKTAATTWVEAT
jgi:hypothetical protein